VKKGFDQFYGFLGGGTPPMNPRFDHTGEPQQLTGPCPDLITTAALDFIQRNQKAPFLVCLHFREPHLPYGPVPEEDSAPFKNLDPQIPDVKGTDREQLKQWHRDYYGSIHALDRNVGRVLRLLDDLKLAGNTWVIFTSDHGYNNGRHGVETKGNGQWIAGGVRGPKRPNMWDTSIKVPLLMRWPGVIEPGRQIDDAVANIDMYRTVLGALRLPLPDGVTVHGIDYSPALRGDKSAPRDVLFGQYDLHNGGLAYMRMIRSDRYKYVRHFKANQMDELYDLRDDPDETKNLANAPKLEPVRNELSAKLRAWMDSIDDPLLKSTY
jgi:choline-sulfatase